jgi:hypothetical protein
MTPRSPSRSQGPCQLISRAQTTLEKTAGSSRAADRKVVGSTRNTHKTQNFVFVCGSVLENFITRIFDFPFPFESLDSLPISSIFTLPIPFQSKLFGFIFAFFCFLF